ncbi:MAG: class I SAM-dependent methyltransferase [Pseudonocardiaceae bacterium]
MPTRRDYDTDPSRYRLGMRLTAAHRAPEADLHTRIVRLLLEAGAVRVLDIGCGDGALAATAAGSPLQVIGIDAAAAMVRAAHRHGPTMRAEVTALAVADAAVDAVVAVNVLDHLDRPELGLREARRVLRPDGLFVAGTISRADSPELAPIWQPAPTPFDTEDAPGLVAATFGSVETQPWDAPLITLPDRDAVRDFLRARFVPLDEAERFADALADGGRLPLTLTKRGALVLARHTSGHHGAATRIHRGCESRHDSSSPP